MGIRVVILRTLGLLVVLGLLVLLAGPDLPSAMAALRDPQRIVDTRGADVLVLYLMQLALVALCAWCALCVVLFAATSVRPSGTLARLSIRVTPRGGHRLLAAALGIGTLTLAACSTSAGASATVPPSTAPAYAASSDAFDWALVPPADPIPALPTPGAAEAVPAPEPEPDPTPGNGQSSPSYNSVPAGADASPAQRIVGPDQCLWTIADDHLGPGASTAEVAYLVDDLYQANQDVIGADPNVLPVGAILTMPAP